MTNINTFLEALKNKHGVCTPSTTETAKNEPTLEPLTATIQLIINHNRIDVFFNRKPDQRTIDELKERLFRWNPDQSCWYNKDTMLNRAWLAEYFKAQFDSLDPSKAKQQESESTYLTEAYTEYRKQVDQLVNQLGIDPADLMIKAVDCLYKHTIKQLN